MQSSRSLLSSGSSSTSTPYISGDSTHFGYETVNVDEKEERVRRVFDNVADSYDVMNDLMSAGLHRCWKDSLLQMSGVTELARIARRVNRELSILDVAGGTGDVAFRFLEATEAMERAKSSGNDNVSVTVCDINQEMLRVGQSRALQRFGPQVLENKALSFVHGNAEILPFADNSFDLYTIAFGLRNVTNVDRALKEAARVLRPGGRFMCLEFSQVPQPLFRYIYDAYSFNVIPAIGEVVANDRASYQYLVESIRRFSAPDELAARMQTAGMGHCQYNLWTGGIVALHQGWKPLES